jgi:N-methylhydantoinase A
MESEGNGMTSDQQRRFRVSADIGGTFTDLVFQDAVSGDAFTGKILSTPGNPAQAVLEGLTSFLPKGAALDFLVHGTTVGLNAVLERRGARVALVTTENFGDVYTIQGNDRRDIFSIFYRKPKTLVARRDVFTVRERLNADGSVDVPVQLAGLDPVIAAVQAGRYDAIAVCFLHAFNNPVHERAVLERLEAALPGFPVTLSHQVSSEWREFARTSTTVMEAYIAPVVKRYLSTLMEELGGALQGRQLHVMESNGGAMTAAAARNHPIQTLLSGPVGGNIGAEAVAATSGRPNLICIDMGGTSFDASLVVDGKPNLSNEAELEGLPIQMSIVDIHVIGAGGGSLAWLEGGHIRVGPRSAGSTPGPACYGRGGTEPTVTDANAVLGRIDPANFAGGRMTLDLGAARTAVDRIAQALGMETEAMAQGILDIVNAKMADAIRTITVRRGIDPRDFVLFAYGGAGPMQAVALAEELEIKEVIIPVHPGAFSAWGMLHTDVKHEFKQTFYGRWDAVDLDGLELAYQTLEARGRTHLLAEDILGDKIQFARVADFRYVGQEYQISTPMPAAQADKAAVRTGFDAAYLQRYGHANAEATLEIVTLRVMAIGQLDRPGIVAPSAKPAAPRRQRPVYFGGLFHDTAIIDRSSLGESHGAVGPAIIEEPTTTTILPPGWKAAVIDGGHLSLTRA